MSEVDLYSKIAVIVAGGVALNLIVSALAMAGSWKLILWRIAKLEEKVERHNGFSDRVTRLEAVVHTHHRRDDVEAEANA